MENLGKPVIARSGGPYQHVSYILLSFQWKVPINIK